MGPISAGFVKLSIIVLGLVTFIFNITILVTISKTKIRFTKNTFRILETRVVDVSVEERDVNAPRGLNQHMWMKVCATSIDFLCNVPLFPKVPNRRAVINGTEFSWSSNEGYAERIFGFLRPPKTGSYVFAISSDDSSELWLSSDEKFENSVLIANVGEKGQSNAWTSKYDYLKYPTQISDDIPLVADKKYYIEILHVQSGNDNHIVVQWKDSLYGNFSDIKVDYLSPFMIDDDSPKTSVYDDMIHEAKSCQNLTKENPFLLQRHLTYAKHEDFELVLPNLDLKRRHDVNKTINKTYDSLTKHYHKSMIYSTQSKGKFIHPWNIQPSWDCGEINEKDAEAIVDSFMEKLNVSHKGMYTLKSIVNIEKTNFTNSSRYLLELDLIQTTTNTTIHLSEYIHQDKTNPEQLYYIDTFQWKKDIQITFVVTAKNQGTWIRIFLNDMAKMLRRTRDPNVNAIIFDYESGDIDLQKAVLQSGIGNRVKTLSKPGRYSRRESFNLAIELVEDPHTIVFLVDLHLTFGDALFNDIRKHTIEGQLVYTPIIVRQWDCSTPNNKIVGLYYGYYEILGFGIIAMYKSDWDRIGGFSMNDKNKYKWGGEDYELMDAVYLNDLDYVRVKCPYVYHYSHIRDGMWS